MRTRFPANGTPLAAQPETLLLPALARQRNSAAGGQDAVPGQMQTGRAAAQRPTYPAGRTRAVDGLRDIAVSGDFSPRNGGHDAIDCFSVGLHRPASSHSLRRLARRIPKPVVFLRN